MNADSMESAEESATPRNGVIAEMIHTNADLGETAAEPTVPAIRGGGGSLVVAANPKAPAHARSNDILSSCQPLSSSK